MLTPTKASRENNDDDAEIQPTTMHTNAGDTEVAGDIEVVAGRPSFDYEQCSHITSTPRATFSKHLCMVFR